MYDELQNCSYAEVPDFDHSAKTILRPVLAVTSSDERLEASDALLEWSCAHAQHADFKIGGIVPQPKTTLVSFEELLQSRATTCVVALKTCRARVIVVVVHARRTFRALE